MMLNSDLFVYVWGQKNDGKQFLEPQIDTHE